MNRLHFRGFGQSPWDAFAAIWRAARGCLNPRKGLRFAVHEELERLWEARRKGKAMDAGSPEYLTMARQAYDLEERLKTAEQRAADAEALADGRWRAIKDQAARVRQLLDEREERGILLAQVGNAHVAAVARAEAAEAALESQRAEMLTAMAWAMEDNAELSALRVVAEAARRYCYAEEYCDPLCAISTKEITDTLAALDAARKEPNV